GRRRARRQGMTPDVEAMHEVCARTMSAGGALRRIGVARRSDLLARATAALSGIGEGTALVARTSGLSTAMVDWAIAASTSSVDAGVLRDLAAQATGTRVPALPRLVVV